MRSDRVLSAAAALIFVCAGCDYVDRRFVDRERADSIYRAAMADYGAGEIDKAVSGLERVIAATPSNSSARFQLACLLQDSRKDYLGAICHYREFLLLDRSGDKSGLARDRIVQCERLLGPELMKRFDLGGNSTLADENASLKERVSALTKTNADLEKRLEQAMARARASADEVGRMRKMLRGEPTEDVSRPKIETVESLLDDEEGDTEDRIRFSKDVRDLVLEEEKEKVTTPFVVAEKKPAAVVKQSESEPPHEERPPEYVVQEGDTLYRIAVRFYGQRSAWNKIREANKAVISTDGRIKVGQKIVLP